MIRLAETATKLFISGVVFGVLLSCAGPRGSQTIKPLESYTTPIQRDIAQMVYPGFLEIQEEIALQFPKIPVRIQENGMQVRYLSKVPDVSEGYFIEIAVNIEPEFPDDMDLLQQAQQIGTVYFQKMLIAMSRDWNTVFSSSVTGTIFQYHWETETQNRMRVIFRNTDVQEYLNARMTLQQLVDRSRIEGWQADQPLGRIEINGLSVEQA